MSDINISLTNSEIKYKPMSNYIKISPNEVKIKTGNKKLEKVFYIICGILTIVLIYFLFNFFSYSFSKTFKEEMLRNKKEKRHIKNKYSK